MVSSKGVALILGGSRGIGRGLAERLAKDGYDISLIARNQANLTEVAGVCAQLGAKSVTFALDVTNDALLKQAVEQTVAQLGSIDVLICAVGQTEFAPFDKLSIEGTNR